MSLTAVDADVLKSCMAKLNYVHQKLMACFHVSVAPARREGPFRA